MTEREREKINARTDRCHACVSYHSLQRQQGTGGHDSWLVDTKQEEKKKSPQKELDAPVRDDMAKKVNGHSVAKATGANYIPPRESLFLGFF